MLNFAFISRHVPTSEQYGISEQHGINLVPIGDADAFTVSIDFVLQYEVKNNIEFDGVVIVHPSAAMRLCEKFLIGVFKNDNRAPVGEKPQFLATELHIYDMRS